eukprot:689235-Alexandrium_andersonii.AAC.1
MAGERNRTRMMVEDSLMGAMHWTDEAKRNNDEKWRRDGDESPARQLPHAWRSIRIRLRLSSECRARAPKQSDCIRRGKDLRHYAGPR